MPVMTCIKVVLEAIVRVVMTAAALSRGRHVHETISPALAPQSLDLRSRRRFSETFFAGSTGGSGHQF